MRSREEFVPVSCCAALAAILFPVASRALGGNMRGGIAALVGAGAVLLLWLGIPALLAARDPFFMLREERAVEIAMRAAEELGWPWMQHTRAVLRRPMIWGQCTWEVRSYDNPSGGGQVTVRIDATTGEVIDRAREVVEE